MPTYLTDKAEPIPEVSAAVGKSEYSETKGQLKMQLVLRKLFWLEMGKSPGSEEALVTSQGALLEKQDGIAQLLT